MLVTSLVRAHLETDNPRVAIIKGDRVIGVGAGKTNVRVSWERVVRDQCHLETPFLRM